MAVVDASVWVALCHGGDRHHKTSAAAIRELLANGERLSAPTLLKVEVAAALRRLTGDSRLVRTALAETDRFAELGWIDFFELTHERSLRAAEIAAKTGVRGADAVYLELAAQRGETLITWDRQQLARGAAVTRVTTP